MLLLKSRRGRTLARSLFAAASLLVANSGPRAEEFPEQTHRVEAADLQSAMASEASKGYNLQVSTTAARFATAVILELVASARTERPDGPPLLLHCDDWYESYRQTVGLDSSEVPPFIALQPAHQQSRYVDYRPAPDRVRVKEGPAPLEIIHVMAGWPGGEDVPDKYTFVDSAASPTMRVTNKRRVSYWLLRYPDMIVQDHVEGIGGRPLEGALGTVFKVIGDGHAVQSRFAVADDGLMVTYATAKKGLFKIHPTSVTGTDGKVQKGIPEHRDDLRAIEARLKQKIKLKYDD